MYTFSLQREEEEDQGESHNARGHLGTKERTSHWRPSCAERLPHINMPRVHWVMNIRGVLRDNEFSDGWRAVSAHDTHSWGAAGLDTYFNLKRRKVSQRLT